MIPPTLHQTWRSAPVPEPYRSYCASWPRHNPALTCRFYDDAACRDLVARDFPHLLATYDELPFPVERADLFRYLVVYRFGGIYADIDMECLRSIAAFLDTDDAVLSVETRLTRARQRELGYPHPYQIANCIFAAPPGHPFFARVVERVVDEAHRRSVSSLEGVEDRTGPRLLTRVFYETDWPRTRVLPRIFWMPPTVYPNLPPLNRNMHARHHFAGTWKGRAEKSLARRWVERDILPNPFPLAPAQTFGPLSQAAANANR